MGSRFWNPERRARLIDLAAQGFDVNGIAAALGTSRGSICTYAGREKIEIPGEEAFKRERNRAWWREKSRRETEKKRAERKAEAAKRGPISKTSADYRNRFLPIENLSKRELQAMFAEAAQNTARLTV